MNENILYNSSIDLKGSVNGVSNYFNAATIGNAYYAAASYSVSGLSLLGFAIQLKNLSSSNKTIYIDHIYVANTGNRELSYIRLYSGGSLTGTSATPAVTNVKIGASIGTNFQVGATYSTSNQIPVTGETGPLESLQEVASLYNGVLANLMVLPPDSAIDVVFSDPGVLSTGASVYVRINFWQE